MKQLLLAKKSLDDLLCAASDNKHELNRTLGPLQLTLLGIGGIIGAGIFVMTGQAAALYAGPSIAISFVFSGLACAFAALCYAEFAAMIPIAGSAYTYAYATMGELIAWIIGWNLVLEYLFSAGCVAIGWSGYMMSFLRDFGINLPPEMTAASGTHLINVPEQGWVMYTTQLASSLRDSGIDPHSLQHTTALLNVPAVAIVAFITWVLVRGIKDSAIFNDIIVAVKLGVVLLFILFGFHYVNTGNWTPFIPPNTGEWGHFGWSGIMRGAGVIFFAYIGFDAVSTAAQETKNPKRDMPIGILASLGVCTVLYILV
ncbi:MAG: amino acid permease, partial [Elusimicrobia bacterium]|nr:amino acid permease [Elusimicrobiota bacterium]